MTSNENAEPQLSEQDLEDLAAMGIGGPSEEPPNNTLLRIWSEVLSNVEASKEEDVEMGIAGKIVAGWPQISFQETQRYHELYHDYLLDVRSLLQAAIEDKPGCTEVDPEEDMAENYEIYKELVIGWNLYFDDREAEWRAEDEESHLKFAALVDARGFLFSRQGFAGHLESRGFSLDAEEIEHALRENRGEK